VTSARQAVQRLAAQRIAGPPQPIRSRETRPDVVDWLLVDLPVDPGSPLPVTPRRLRIRRAALLGATALTTVVVAFTVTTGGSRTGPGPSRDTTAAVGSATTDPTSHPTAVPTVDPTVPPIVPGSTPTWAAPTDCAAQMPVAPDWDRSRPGPAAHIGQVSSVTICAYDTSPAASSHPLEAWTSRRVLASDAQAIADSIDAAHPGPVPDGCSGDSVGVGQGYETHRPELGPLPAAPRNRLSTTVFLHFRRSDGSTEEAVGHYFGCTGRWIVTSTGISQATMAQMVASLLTDKDPHIGLVVDDSLPVH